MEIRTKFNVGEKVYRLQYILMETKNRTYKWTYVLDTISCVYTRTQNFTRIIYWFKSLRNETLEQDCFATKEEAQKECERRNGKG